MFSVSASTTSFGREFQGFVILLGKALSRIFLFALTLKSLRSWPLSLLCSRFFISSALGATSGSYSSFINLYVSIMFALSRLYANVGKSNNFNMSS